MQVSLMLGVLTVSCFCSSITARTLNIGVSLPYGTVDISTPLAVHVATAELQRRKLLEGYTFRVIPFDSKCDSRLGMSGTVALRMAEGLDVIIGDGCSRVCQPQALLSAAWNIPVVSFYCSSFALSDKSIYPTFSRVNPIYNSYIDAVIAAMKEFEWDRLAIVAGPDDLFKSAGSDLKRKSEEEGMTVYFYTLESTITVDHVNQKNLDIQLGIIHEIKSKVKMVFLLIYMAELRNFLITCHDEGLLNGDYAFMGLETAFYTDPLKIYRPELGEGVTHTGLMSMTNDVVGGPKWDRFTAEVDVMLKSGIFNNTPGLMHYTEAKTDIVAGFAYDATMLWGYGVNKTLMQNHSAEDGLAITSQFKGYTIDGITGDLIIDENGYRLRDLRHGQKVQLMHWNARERKMSKTYKPKDANDWSGVFWSGNATTPPSGSPVCGWDGELCQARTSSHFVYIIIAVVITLVCGLVILLFWRFQHERHKIEDSLVSWSTVTPIDSVAGSQVTLSSEQRVFTAQLAKLGPDIIVVRALGTSFVSSTSKLVQQELIAMRSVQHQNLNTFRGLCLEQDHNLVLMSYAQRGSLHDIIRQEAVQLTSDIKLSLLMDVAQGMKYLHQSDIGFHGNLSSHNCVIDHRWICKVTDYGFHYVTIQSYGGMMPEKTAEKLLWRAPELLDPKHSTVDASAMKGGDIYSFGVIVQEVILEDEPYAAITPHLDASTIINKLKAGDTKLVPLIPNGQTDQDIISMVENCCSHNVIRRPKFSLIIKDLRNINAGPGQESFIDKMILRLESHTQNLENIVTKRTILLHEEKMKVEHLLSELLPATIVNDIKLGHPVVAETFEQVTLFFSDIVGFTRISAAGTPMDVVKMLNLMYTVFDDVSSKYDVYKVATIGDAYYVASGVPVRNGSRHALEIANMALALLDSAAAFSIPHLPMESLQIRTGIHSGSCVAGVVGIKTPRYLLFGEAVDVAAHMESSGEAMRIHVSDAASELLILYPHLSLEARGLTKLSAFLEMDTFWLKRA